MKKQILTMLVGALGLSGGVGYMLGKPVAPTLVTPLTTKHLSNPYLQCLQDNLAATQKAEQAHTPFGKLDRVVLKGATLTTRAPNDSNWVTIDLGSPSQTVTYRGVIYTDEAIGDAWMLNAGNDLPKPVMLTSGFGSALVKVCARTPK